MKKNMTTEELIAYCKKNEGQTIEAELALAGGICKTTHRLCWWESRLEDCGCDDVWYRTSAKRFLQTYGGANWLVYADLQIR